MKAIVTGGAGFIGTNLVKKLMSLGHEVLIIDNLATGFKENVPSALHAMSFIKEDVRNIHHSHHCFIDCDVIFHLGALPRIQPSIKDPFETVNVNSVGTMAMLEVVRQIKYKSALSRYAPRDIKMIYAGSSSFYGDPNINPYSHSKWLGEEHCKMYSKTYGVSTAIARFFNVYGPHHLQSGPFATVVGIFEKQKKDGKSLTVTGDGLKRRDFTHVDDIVNGLIAMSEKEWSGEVFNLGRGENFSINEVAKMFDAEIEYIPARQGEAQDTLADLTFSKANLQWEPKVNIVDYVSNYIKAL